MKIYPNPYHHLDHKGRLAGACPMEPAHRAGQRSFVCAELVLVGKEERKGDPRGDREEYAFTFSAEPMSISADPGWYYMQRARSGEVFAPRDGKAPMAEWRAARAAAIAKAKAEGTEPDTSGWAAQFPLDKDIAAPAATAGGSK